MTTLQRPLTSRPRPLDWLQPAVLTGSLLPFAAILYRAATGRLGANPVATALNQLGLLALLLLVACLCCTPLKVVFGWSWPIRVRKTLGLCAFFAALAHFVVYATIDQGLDFRALAADLAKRPFIIVGFIALVLLVPLALTSTKKALQRLGHARWKRLHSLVYVVVIVATVHFFLRVKADKTEPLIYGCIFATLFAVRVFDAVRNRAAGEPRQRTVRE